MFFIFGAGIDTVFSIVTVFMLVFDCLAGLGGAF